MDRGVWQATVHKVTKSGTWLSDSHILCARTHTHTHIHIYIHMYISHFPDPFIHWYYMYSLTVFSNHPHFLLPLILGENLSSCNSCKVSQWPMFKNYIPWNVLCLLLVVSAPIKSLLQKLFEFSLTPTLSTMINANSASVVFTKTTVFLDCKINTFFLYKSLRENLKIIKEKVKVTYNQDITTAWVFINCLFTFDDFQPPGDGGKE